MPITRVLARWISNYDDQRSLGAKLRAKRIAPLLQMIESIYKKNGAVRIIDIGGTKTYWNIIPNRYLSENNVTITILNLPGEVLTEDYDRFIFVAADACNLANFKDKQFDIAHSNSVLEHVGDWSRMLKFSEELKRVSKYYFCQTPNYWFPIEPHSMTPFFHWLPKPIRLWLLLNFQLGHWKKANSIDDAILILESAQLINKKMLQALFKDGSIVTERFFLLPKSLIAIRSPVPVFAKPDI